MKESIRYRPLEYNECARIREIDASQYIGRAWRRVDGVLQLVTIDYLETGFPEGFDFHLGRLQKTVEGEGIAFGAFNPAGKMVGFSALNLLPFGTTTRYALLEQLFVSRDYRKMGIGKELFLLSAACAKKNDIQKLYICAGSSEDTIAFYRVLGCVNALEINPQLYERDLRDIQLEYTV